MRGGIEWKGRASVKAREERRGQDRVHGRRGGGNTCLDGCRRQPLLDVLEYRFPQIGVKPRHQLLVKDAVRISDRRPEGLVRVPKLLIQRPRSLSVESLHVDTFDLGHMPQDRVYGLRALEPLVTLLQVFRRHAALGQVNVPLLLVNAQHHAHLLLPYPDELVDRADPAAAELGEQDHALDVIVLEE